MTSIGALCSDYRDELEERIAGVLPGLDEGVRREVETLMRGGVETFESCQGGVGHSYPEPTVRFHGQLSAGWRALTLALEHGYRVTALRRTWDILDGEPVGPYWEIVFGPREGDR